MADHYRRKIRRFSRPKRLTFRYHLSVSLLNDFFDVGEIVLIDQLPDAFAEVLVANACIPHIGPIF
jgi:hypothetical protein